MGAAAKRGNDDIGIFQAGCKAIEGGMVAADPVRQRGGAVGGGGGDRNPAKAGGAQMLDHQHAHFAETDQQPGTAGELTMDVPGQTHRRGGDRDRTFADRGLRTYAFGDRVRGLQNRIEFGSDHAGGAGQAIVGLDLPQDVRLADDLAVQRRRDREHVTQRIDAAEAVELTAQRHRLDAGLVGHDPGDGVDRIAGLRRVGLHLDPVAGRMHQRLVETGIAKPGQETGDRPVFQIQAVANRRRAGPVVGADHEDAECDAAGH